MNTTDNNNPFQDLADETGTLRFHLRFDMGVDTSLLEGITDKFEVKLPDKKSEPQRFDVRFVDVPIKNRKHNTTKEIDSEELW